MSPGVTFERVYHALKDQLGSGRFAAGEHLEPAALSQDLNASITPVRDALHRLAGEGLVEAPRGDGFRTPLVTEIGLRHRYRWNGALLVLAARSRRGGEPPALGGWSEDDGIVAATEHLFLMLAGWPGNPEHAAAVARLNDRLRPVRRREADFLTGLDDELGAIADLMRAAAWPPLRRALAAFHRRRERIVAELVAALVAPR